MPISTSKPDTVNEAYRGLEILEHKTWRSNFLSRGKFANFQFEIFEFELRARRGVYDAVYFLNLSCLRINTFHVVKINRNETTNIKKDNDNNLFKFIIMWHVPMELVRSQFVEIEIVY